MTEHTFPDAEIASAWDDPSDRLMGSWEIIRERERQVSTKGYDDAEHTVEGLVAAARAYILYDEGNVQRQIAREHIWPWAPRDFTPGTKRENLIRAGALIAAAIDRLDAEEEQRAT